MALYSRRQLLLILLLCAAAGAGLGVDHWRRTRPELAERLERLDRPPAAPPRAMGSPAPPGAAPAVSHPDRPTPRRPRREPPAQPLDVNRATEADLTGLPGVGPALAARIVAARPFREVDDLRRVPGLRRTTLERLRPHLTVGGDAR